MNRTPELYEELSKYIPPTQRQAFCNDFHEWEKKRRMCSNIECGKVDVRTKLCALCRTARYCSVECQRTMWKTHKPECTEIVNRRVVEGTHYRYIGTGPTNDIVKNMLTYENYMTINELVKTRHIPTSQIFVTATYDINQFQTKPIFKLESGICMKVEKDLDPLIYDACDKLDIATQYVLVVVAILHDDPVGWIVGCAVVEIK
jgi:hypothetical protein